MRKLFSALTCVLFLLASFPAVGKSFIPPDSSPRLGTENRYIQWPSGRPVRVLRRFDPPAQPWLPGHRGVDLDIPAGCLILAAVDATVIYAGMLVDRPVVSLQDATGLRYTYEPVEPSVAVGDQVRRGDPIGILLSGHLPGRDALHFGVKDGPKHYLNPLQLLGATVVLFPD